MKSNQRRKQRLLAAREAARSLAAREDARVETLVRLGPSANRYEGATPHEIDGAHTFAPRVMQTRMSTHEGTTRRSGKKATLKFVPRRYDAGAPKHGGARLAPGETLADTHGNAPTITRAGKVKPNPKYQGPERIARTVVGNTAYRPDRGPFAGEVIRFAAPALNILAGDDDAKLPESTDPGDDERTTLERAYWARIHAEVQT
jgi:hypothetical protein